jgi:translation initiation factor 2B subunit (eIF-2B alpha/beta/delta family)
VFVGEADIVLLGADALTQRGAVNKVGSRLIALAAREAGVPVYACCDGGKVAPAEPLQSLVALNTSSSGGGGGGEGHEEKGAAEVEAGWPPQLRPAESGGGGGGAVGVRNIYFEEVSLGLLAGGGGGVVTEDGPQRAEDILAAVEARRRLYLDAFALCTLDHPPK